MRIFEFFKILKIVENSNLKMPLKFFQNIQKILQKLTFQICPVCTFHDLNFLHIHSYCRNDTAHTILLLAHSRRTLHAFALINPPLKPKLRQITTSTLKHFMMSKMQTAAIIFTSFAIQESEIEILIFISIKIYIFLF